MRRIDDWELWARMNEEVKRINPINETEETNLYSDIKSGNETVRARERLTKGYLWLVLKISNQLLVDKHSNRDDVFNSGVSELCECTSRFRVEPGKKFINFAGNCIRGRMWREMRKNDGMVPIPRMKKDLDQRESNIISLSTEVCRDKRSDSVCELWDIIPDPNQVDLDDKIDSDRFQEKFNKVFNRSLRGMPKVRDTIIDSEGLFGNDKISMDELSQLRGVTKSAGYKCRSRGLEILRRSKGMQELYNNL